MVLTIRSSGEMRCVRGGRVSGWVEGDDGCKEAELS